MSGAERVFVDVHHFGLGRLARFARDDAGQELSGTLRRDGKDGGMDLHAGRHAEHGRFFIAESSAHVAGRAVAAGEDDQLRARIAHGAHCADRVLARRFAGRAVNDMI